MQHVENKFKQIGIWGVPIMFIMLCVVVFQSSKVRNTQMENTALGKEQREFTIKLQQMAIKKMDTVISGQDSIFLLFKRKK
jgi:hypothetical protein